MGPYCLQNIGYLIKVHANEGADANGCERQEQDYLSDTAWLIRAEKYQNEVTVKPV